MYSSLFTKYGRQLNRKKPEKNTSLLLLLYHNNKWCNKLVEIESRDSKYNKRYLLHTIHHY